MQARDQRAKKNRSLALHFGYGLIFVIIPVVLIIAFALFIGVV